MYRSILMTEAEGGRIATLAAPKGDVNTLVYGSAVGVMCLREGVLVGARTVNTRRGLDAEDFTPGRATKASSPACSASRAVIRSTAASITSSLGPDEVLAVETKWTSQELNRRDDGTLEIPPAFRGDVASRRGRCTDC
jgi:hypothetical protein